MLVSDASLVVDLLIDGGDRGEWAAGRIASADLLHAPHLLDLEVASAFRKRVQRGELSQRRALAGLRDVSELPILRYPATPLLERIWQLRDRLSPYDAAYVALAEALELPLYTTDLRLARAGGHTADIVSFGG